MSVVYRKEGQVALLTIDRPEVFNCLNVETLKQMRVHIQDIGFDKEIRAVIVTGAGEKAFCAGADLKERRTMSDRQVQEFIRLIRDTFSELEKLPKPTIAAVNGVALGGGTELALACDLRLMSESAQMGLTETSLGIIPGAGGTQRLPRLIGKGKAKELIYTARRVAADEAVQIGLVNKVIPAQRVLNAAMELAQIIISNAPIALAQAKLAIDADVEMDLASGLTLESTAYQVLIPTKDRLEGLVAFQEKRKPIYRGE